MKLAMARRLIIGTILIAIVAVVAVTLLKRGSGADQLVLDYYRVKTDVMEERISGTGTFVPRNASTVLAKVNGAVKTLRVDEGDRVRTGTILLEIDREDYEQNLESRRIALETTRRSARQNMLNLRANYQGALLKLDQAQRTYDNNKALYDAEGISEEVLRRSSDALLSAELSLKSARERLNLTLGASLTDEPALEDRGDDEIISGFPEMVQAALAVDTALKTLSHCTVRAPMGGTVTRVLLNEGGMAGAGTPLIVIEALDDMIAEIQIDEVDIGKIRPGNPAEVTSDSLLGATLYGTVESISPVIQRVGNTRMTKVEVAIDPGEHSLKSGASCTVRISATTKEQALVIPLTAYTTEGEQSSVFVLEQVGTVSSPEAGQGLGADVLRLYALKPREIELGIITINQVEVISGLAEGDLIAMGNQSLLREGLEGTLGTEK
jgi:multidrug resistance efflux pump